MIWCTVRIFKFCLQSANNQNMASRPAPHLYPVFPCNFMLRANEGAEVHSLANIPCLLLLPRQEETVGPGIL